MFLILHVVIWQPSPRPMQRLCPSLILGKLEGGLPMDYGTFAFYFDTLALSLPTSILCNFQWRFQQLSQQPLSFQEHLSSQRGGILSTV